MSFLSVLFAALFYLATAILLGGLIYRIYLFAKAPAPLKIPTTPAPVTESGVAMRMFREIVFFESLFKGTKWTWIFSYMFHFGLLLVLIRHLRYFVDPVWAPLALIQPFGVYGGMAMVVGLAGLWSRRFIVDRVRYISAPSDHFMLALLVLIGLSGLAMKFLVHTDVVAVKQFFVGLLTSNWASLPPDPLLLIHLLLVASLMIVFPFSKLLHAPGIFFSPSRNQVDNPREKRHLANWAKQLEQ